MNRSYLIKPIARIFTDFPQRFGIPRQSGLIPELKGRIVFEPQFRDVNAVKGIEGFSHLWLIWGFSETGIDMSEDPVQWSATVAPPRLGGKIRMGVFATRSPYRPNSLGLSSVRLESVEYGCTESPVLVVSGADLMDQTPIFDIKPYIPYSDSHPDAAGGFAVSRKDFLEVDFPEELLERIPSEKHSAVMSVLSQDPRGSYEKMPGYIYGLAFAGFDIRFTVTDGCLTVCGVEDRSETGGYSNVK